MISIISSHIPKYFFQLKVQIKVSKICLGTSSNNRHVQCPKHIFFDKMFGEVHPIESLKSPIPSPTLCCLPQTTCEPRKLKEPYDFTLYCLFNRDPYIVHYNPPLTLHSIIPLNNRLGPFFWGRSIGYKKPAKVGGFLPAKPGTVFVKCDRKSYSSDPGGERIGKVLIRRLDCTGKNVSQVKMASSKTKMRSKKKQGLLKVTILLLRNWNLQLPFFCFRWSIEDDVPLQRDTVFGFLPFGE